MPSRLDLARALQDRMVAHRRHLHREPEVGLDLPDTHDYLEAQLLGLGLSVEKRAGAGLTVPIAGVGAGRGANAGLPPVVLRADMDALPVTEATGLEFASRRSGAMHACGHDLHMAMLLGVAEALARFPPARDVVLAFQPGEEADRGALATLQHRNLDLERAETFAIHVHATLPAHSVNHRSGTFMSYGDWFRVDFSGPGGHAARPHLVGNPVEAGARFVTEVRAVVDELSADEHLVATVTESIIGNTVNVIPAHGRVRGTLRTLSAEKRALLIERLAAAAARASEDTRTHAEFSLLEGYPAVVNDSSFVDRFTAAVAGTGLAEHLTPMEEPSMVIEDFAYFVQRWPGAMVYLGAQVPGRTSFNHSHDADFDEAVLSTGAALHLLVADGI